VAQRVPVAYQNIPLMPMRWKKARRLILQKRATLRRTKEKIYYIILKFEPSGFKVQPIQLGFDPGSYFDGISVVSSRCHHVNMELLHDKNWKGHTSKTSVTERLKNRSENRRIRRSRKRHRPIRFDNRIGCKLSPTTRQTLDFRKCMLSSVFSLFPIHTVVFEQVAYTGKYQQGWTQVHQGQHQIISFLQSQVEHVKTVPGYRTKSLRISLFGSDLKVEKKDSKTFYAHCLDSFSLSILGLEFQGIVNKVTYFVRRSYLCRRELCRLKANYNDNKYYFRYGKGGVKKYFTKLGKVQKIRVKPEGEHSHHPTQWHYKNLGQATCMKATRKRYGGTIAFGQSRSEVPISLTKRANWDKDHHHIVGYRNRQVELIRE
jgi:hypothetical protein